MNLPSDFSQRTHELLGDNDYRQLEDALQDEAPVSIRVNSAKCDREVKGERVPWSANGIYLAERPTFTFDPLFHAGCYYVQEASSMFVEQVLKTYVSSPVVMLDLCAAPGGKSTAARAVLPDGSLLVANEVMRNRVQILAENLIKWGNTEVGGRNPPRCTHCWLNCGGGTRKEGLKCANLPAASTPHLGGCVDGIEAGRSAYLQYLYV